MFYCLYPFLILSRRCGMEEGDMLKLTSPINYFCCPVYHSLLSLVTLRQDSPWSSEDREEDVQVASFITKDATDAICPIASGSGSLPPRDSLQTDPPLSGELRDLLSLPPLETSIIRLFLIPPPPSKSLDESFSIQTRIPLSSHTD